MNDRTSPYHIDALASWKRLDSPNSQPIFRIILPGDRYSPSDSLLGRVNIYGATVDFIKNQWRIKVYTRQFDCDNNEINVVMIKVATYQTVRKAAWEVYVQIAKDISEALFADDAKAQLDRPYIPIEEEAVGTKADCCEETPINVPKVE